MSTTAAPAGMVHLPVRRKVAHVMGMPISLALRGRHATGERADAAWAEAIETLREVDRVFSTYRAGSVISMLSRGDLALEDCPDEVHEVLALGDLAREQSGGAFDVRRIGPDGIPLLDPSGVVKGWGVDRAARALDTLPSTDFCLSAGGDMVCRTRLRDAPDWRIGIEDPHRPDRIVAVIPMRNGAVATSGLAHRGAHVVDARTGESPTELAAVTVIGPDLVWADIDATAGLALDGDGCDWLRTRGSQRGLVVRHDGTVELFGPS